MLKQQSTDPKIYSDSDQESSIDYAEKYKNDVVCGEDIWVTMSFFRIIGFLGIMCIPEDIKLLSDTYFFQLSKLVSILPISFIILHNEHYTSVYISRNCMYYYDSSGKRPNKKFRKEITNLAKKLRGNEIKFIYNKTKHQGDSGNCGHFAMKHLFSQYSNKHYIDWNYKGDDSINGEKMIEQLKESPSYNLLYLVSYPFELLRIITYYGLILGTKYQFSKIKKNIVRIFK